MTADGVEVTGYPDLARQYHVSSVPKTVLGEGIEFVGALPEKPFDSPAWSVICKDGTHIFAGIGQVVDLLWVEDLKRMYYIEFDVSAVRFSPDPKTPFIWKMRS